jgi:hypothetical protein
MKAVLKISLVVFSLLVVVAISAQKFALESGYVNLTRSGPMVRSTYLQGGKIGLTAKFDLKNNFSFLTGGLYTVVYGYEIQKAFPSTQANFTNFGHFFDVPLQVQYAIPLSKTMNIFGYAGPTLNIGLTQPQKVVSNRPDVLAGKYDLFHENTVATGVQSLSRLNLQGSIGGGIQWKRLQIKSGYDVGLLNINRLSNGNIYQKGWSVSLVYEFGK